MRPTGPAEPRPAHKETDQVLGVNTGQTGKTRCVVGLGNPGRRYARTRHNVGFQVVEALAARWKADGPREAFGGSVYDARPAAPRGGREVERIVLLRPLTFMNCSGQAVGKLARYFKVENENILIVLDDIALPPGQLRLRAGGSAGGHKGLADVVAALDGEDVPRLRIGIGEAPAGMDAADHVLGRFEKSREPAIAQAVTLAAQAAEAWVFEDIAAAMSQYNQRPADR